MSKLDEIIERHDLWVIGNVEHGIFIPLPHPETKQKVKALIKELVNTVVGGDSFIMPMRSMRTRNTAFKKYATKYFNTRIKERRDRVNQKIEDL